MSIFVISNHISFRVLFDKIVFVGLYFKSIYRFYEQITRRLIACAYSTIAVVRYLQDRWNCYSAA